MAIDYVVAYDCRLKAELGVQGLVQHLRHCMILELAELCAEVSPTRTLAGGGANGTGGAGAVPANIASLMRKADSLAGFRKDCARCPASVFSGRGWGIGGCAGFVTVPMEGQCEDSMAEFVERALNLPEGHPLPIWLDGLVECDGRDLSRWQARRQVYTHGEPEYFERATALSMRVGNRLGGGTLTTDAVWEYLFEAASETPVNAACAAQFCSDFLIHIGSSMSWARMEVLLRDSRSVEDLVEYGTALVRAEVLGTTAQVMI